MLGAGARARDAPLEPPAGEHPADLVCEQEQRGDRRRVVGLVLERVLERRGQRGEGRDPAPARRELGDPLLRGGAEQREPQPAVGGEALLRGKVIGVGLHQLDRQPAGAGGGVDQHECLSRVGGADHGNHHAGGGLVVRPRQRIDPRPRGAGPDACRVGRVARLGGDDHRLGEEGRALADGCELVRELAVGQVQRALAHQPERGGVPERRGTAVAERHLVAVGRREQLLQAHADLGHERPHRRLAMRGAHQRCPGRREVCERLAAHARRAAAEPPVGGPQVSWDDQSLRCLLGTRRHVGLLAGGPRSGVGGCPGARLCCSPLPGG